MKVMISPGYGAGWSTLNNKELATDKRVIEAFESGMSEKDMQKYLSSIGYDNVYMGGYDACVLEEVPKGTMFEITEYDGHESIRYIDINRDFILADY